MSRLAKAGIRILAMLLISCMGCQFVQAQNLFIGIKGGFIATSDMQYATRGGSKSKSYTFGPTLEAKLPFERMSIEASLLYHRVGYKSTFEVYPNRTSINQVRGDLFEVPLLLKYYSFDSSSTIQPFLLVGPVISILANAENKNTWLGIDPVTGEQTVSTYESNVSTRRSPYGWSIGMGMRRKSGWICFSPEIRYTKCYGLLFGDTGSHGYRVKSSTDKLEFMLNLSFVP